MLTDATIKKLPDPESDRLIPAGGRDGLYLRHRATGRKTWVIRRRVSGSWRVETLGDWPTLTTLNARRKAAMTEPAKASPLTFGEASDDFYKEVILPRYRRAASQAERYFSRDCAELLRRRLDKVTRADLARLVRAKAADTPNAAAKLLALLKQFYQWAMLAELVHVDPTAGLTARALSIDVGGPRERVLDDAEIRALWAIPDEPYGRILRFALLTACRIGEAQAFADDQVVGDVWTIPETKNGRPHTVPLSTTAQALAAAGWPKRNYNSLHEYLESKHLAGWRPHDLRRTAATRMRDAGVSVDVIEAVLNHAPPKLIRTYQRPNMVPAMREALVRLEGVISTVVADA